MLAFLAVLVSYLLGSISFSYLAGKLLKGIDIRKHGSGNAGATNTLRVLGKGPGIVVFLLDILKGVAAVLIGMWWVGGEWVPVLAGLFSIIGHNWPIYFGFRGGKGVATTVGVMGVLSFWPMLIAGLVAILLIAVTRYVSLGSLFIAFFLPVFIMIAGKPIPVLLISLLLGVFSIIRHRSNIVKLIQRREHKIGSKM